MNDAPDTIPWYQSAIIRRLALSIVVQILAVTGLSKYLVGANIAVLTDDLLEIAGIAYAAWAVHARVTKVTPPVAATQAKADAANDPLSPPKESP